MPVIFINIESVLCPWAMAMVYYTDDGDRKTTITISNIPTEMMDELDHIHLNKSHTVGVWSIAGACDIPCGSMF